MEELERPGRRWKNSRKMKTDNTSFNNCQSQEDKEKKLLSELKATREELKKKDEEKQR